MIGSQSRRAPEGFRLSLTPAAGISLVCAEGALLELRFSPVGQRARVQSTSKTVDVEMSAGQAASLAVEALSSTFGPRGRRAGPSPAAVAEPERPLRVPFCAIDLCHLRPRFADGERVGTLPCRLLWQWWLPPGREAVDLDLGSASAVALSDPRTGVTTLGILDLLAVETEAPADAQGRPSPDALSRAARFFATKLSDTLPADSLTYLVPDATDEFALGTLRRSINSAYRAAEPLPRSVATVFAWQSSARFSDGEVREGDCVIVFDTVGSTLSATPLFARLDNRLARRVPESAGIHWERTPSVLCDVGVSSTALAAAMLERLGCPFPEEPARLCGLQGLADEGSQLSWQGEDGAWFTLPQQHEQAFRDALRGMPDVWQALAEGLDRELRRLDEGARIHVLHVGGVRHRVRLKAPRVHHGHNVWLIEDENEPHLGGVVLHAWQARAGDIALWRDHLPELSMRIIEDGLPKRFYLVKDDREPVVPRRGKPVPIPIAERFTLPAGRPHYRFPLLQGAGGSALRYEAFLRSPAFPLDKDLPVKVELTYSYGSDTPYDLCFTPLAPAPGLPFVRAEWRLREDADDLPAHFPTVPPALPWSGLRQYPRRDSSEPSDLLDWIRKELARVASLASPRHTGVVDSTLRRDVNRQRYVFADAGGGRVFCHESDFIEPDAIETVRRGDALTFDIELRDNRNPRGRTIVVGTGAASEARILDYKASGLTQDMRHRLRFPFRTVWSEGRTLGDPDVPGDFRELMRREGIRIGDAGVAACVSPGAVDCGGLRAGRRGSLPALRHARRRPAGGGGFAEGGAVEERQPGGAAAALPAAHRAGPGRLPPRLAEKASRGRDAAPRGRDGPRRRPQPLPPDPRHRRVAVRRRARGALQPRPRHRRGADDPRSFGRPTPSSRTSAGAGPRTA